MKNMSIVALSVLALWVDSVFAYDGSQVVNGVTWYYSRIDNGNGGCSASITRKDSGGNSYSGALTIPSKLGGYAVTEIGGTAFVGCESLTAVTIPSSVKSVEYCAFRACKGLSSMSIPSSVTKIGWCAFESCSKLMSFSVADDNPNYKSINGLLCTKDGAVLLAGVNGDVVIPSSVTSIGKYAFDGCENLKSVTIPPSVTNIGVSAFRSCNGLSSVIIPSGVTSIGECAFRACKGLSSVTISASVTSIGECAFDGCESLKSVTIPSSVTSIGGNTFRACKELSSVIIPVSVTNIEDYAFDGCESLKSVTIPSSNTSIAKDAFDNGCKLCILRTGQTDEKGVDQVGSNPTGAKLQALPLAIKQENDEADLNDCVRSICRQSGVESISKDDWNVLVKFIKERDARKAAAYLLLLKAAAEAQQAQRESTRQSQPRLDPGIAAMMNYKPSYGSSSPSRSSLSSPSWKCRYCGLVVNGPAPTPNSGSRCAGRELGPDPGPHVFDKN